jgi:hypothetical protein
MFTVQSVILIARSQLSYHEGHDASGWDNVQKYSEQLPGMKWSDGQPWCDVFANWCFWQAGIEVPKGALSASCAASVAAYKKAGRWSVYPVIGAQVFYGEGGGAHTGICVGYDLQHEIAIEGNTNTDGSAEGDGVYQKERERRIPYVYGYGIPYYPHDTAQTPDPAWSGKSLAR